MPTSRVLSSRWVPLTLAVSGAALAALPQILPIHQIVDHQDPLFSIWRTAWIGHALAHAPSQLFHGNVFHPQPYTLTYSDAVLLQGVATAGLTLAGASVAVAYNLLIWLSFPLSALTMFLLAEKVSRSAWAALPAALAYALSAYRFDHIMHLEIIWTQWLPLHFYLAMEAYERGTWRSALAVGASLVAQLFSCLYLFLFSITALPIAAAAQFAAARNVPWRALIRLLLVGVVLVAPLAAAYAHVYTLGLREVGPRLLDEVRIYSAGLGSFFASPERNLIFGWTEAQWGGINEKQLFPGLVALLLGMVALVRARGPHVWALGAVTAFSIAMALGVHGPLYTLFYTYVPGYANLRVPTRYGGFVSMGVAGLAACGLATLLRAHDPRKQMYLIAVVAVLILIETSTGPAYRRSIPETPTPVDTYFAKVRDAVLIEYPFPSPGWLPHNDHLYQMRSIHHWRPLVNGYSGNYPPEYLRLIDRLSDKEPGGAAWLDLLRSAGATHLVVHKHLDKPDITGGLLYVLEQRRDVESIGELACWPDSCAAYKLHGRP